MKKPNFKEIMIFDVLEKKWRHFYEKEEVDKFLKEILGE